MRYAINISAYIYADTDEEAFEKANEICRSIDTEDNKPRVDGFCEKGTRTTRDVYGGYISHCVADF